MLWVVGSIGVERAFLIYFLSFFFLCVLFDVSSAFKSNCLFVCIVSDVDVIFFVKNFGVFKKDACCK